ncbi:MAG: lysine 2,3-aminomutase, partial [Planctomycetota bacterium]
MGRNAERDTVSSLTNLVARGLVAPGEAPLVRRVLERFSVAITDDMLSLIDALDPNDPIAAQFVPRADELEVREVELPDPIGDDAHSPLKGITHRYPDRVLLKPLHVCPVYCRFCFRREVVGPEGGLLTAKELDAALDYIAR